MRRMVVLIGTLSASACSLLIEPGQQGPDDRSDGGGMSDASDDGGLPAGDCPSLLTMGDTSCFTLREYNLSWYDADAACKAIEGASAPAHLAVFESVAEFEEVLGAMLAAKQEDAWVGLYKDPADNWSWVTGADFVAVTGWSTSDVRYSPTGRCALLEDNGNFVQAECDHQDDYLCEYDGAEATGSP